MICSCQTISTLNTAKINLKVCFFAYVRDKRILQLCEFYNNDINILNEMGFEVILATRFKEIPSDCDLYYAWWWGTGILPLIKALFFNKPIIIVGNVRLMKSVGNGIPQVNLLKYLCIRLSWNFSTAIITTSNYEHNIVTKYRKKDTFMVYHGINTKIYRPNTNFVRKDFIYTICNLYGENARRKRISEILKAFALVLQQFPQYKLIISGGNAGFNDNTMIELQELTKKLGIEQKVIFTGSITLEEKIHYYQTTKIFLQPSTYEGFGLAIAEAMACGAPVVVCSVGAVPEVVGDCGVYVSGIPKDIADGMLKLLKDENLRTELAVKGQQRIQNDFSYETRRRNISYIVQKTMNQEIR
jgi:glycosyltransferase involved in cell wall biosynthesis